MKGLVTVIFEPEGRRVRTALGTTIFQAASEAGVGIRSECGGEGKCGKCRVVVPLKSALNEVTTTEMKHLSSSEIDSGYRLACCALIKEDAVIMIPTESRTEMRKIQIVGLERPVALNPLVKKFHITLPKPTLSDARPDLERLLECLKQKHYFYELEIDYELLRELPDLLRDANWGITVTVWNNRKIIAIEKGNTLDKLFGLAIDIGTSKIVVYVVDLTTGRTMGIGSIENPQVIHGEDIISRITYAMTGNEKLETLQKLIVKGINDALQNACIEATVNPRSIYEATVVGNTAMHHFFLAIQPKHIAFSPFTPAIKRSIDIEARQLNIKMHPGGIVHVLPIIAGFVGADAVADILSTGIHESEKVSLLIDIGTNTEVFVGNAEDILSCSCASGPAFEGAHIKHGMKAVTGAIEKLRVNPDSYEVEYETIGGTKPVGLCGSAMIDVTAELFKCRIINRRGRFNLKIKTPRLKVVNSDIAFVVARKNESGTGKEITVTQKDINEIQLAKAAIFTGCSILMKRKKVNEKDINRVFMAGAFGSYINPESAKFIGLTPDVPTKKIKFVGNTAITGAELALISKEARKTAKTISEKVRYLELSVDPDFTLEFSNAMFLPHKDLDRFPSVKTYFNRM